MFTVSDMQIHNTNTQIHKYKYKNTVWVKFADTPNMCYIFGKIMVKASKNQCSRVSDLHIQKYKYTNTNTKIQFGSKLHISPTYAIFLRM